jgi:MATE family multidrug resistance protein
MSEVSPLPAASAPSPWRAELSATLALAWPLVLMQVAQISINTTEVFLLGRLGSTELAGAVLGSALFHAVFLFELGLAIAVAPIIAQARGAGQFRVVRRAVRQGLWATTLVALPGALFLWNVRPVLLALGQDPVAVGFAEEFARPMAIGLAPWLWFFVIRNYMAAMGRPQPALYVMVAAILLNAFAGWCLIFGHLGLPAWGVTGAGFAAAGVGWFLPLALLGFALTDRKLRRLAVLGRFWRPDWAVFREIFRIGVPIGLALLFETTLFTAALGLQGLISTISQAAHAISAQLIAIAFMLPLGLSQAATVRVGLAVGRNRPQEARIATQVAFTLGVCCTTFTALLFVFLPSTLLGLFQDRTHPDAAAVIATGVGFLAVGAFFQLFDGAQAVAMGCLRGLKDARVPMLIACFGYWVVGFPLSAILGLWVGWGGVGIWMGLAAGLAAAAVLLVRRVWRQLGTLPLLTEDEVAATLVPPAVPA